MIVLVAFIALGIGYYMRELKEIVARIEASVKLLIHRQQKEEAQEIAKKKGMSFGAPMTMAELAEMDEEDRIAAVNQQMQ